MNEHRKETRYILLSFAFAVVLSTASLLSLIIPLRPQAPDSGADRSPASADLASSKQPDAPTTKFETLDWDCVTLSKTKFSATHLRIKGKKQCKDGAIKQIQILNQTNGFTASVFESDKSFVTDFISLSHGENTLTVKWTDRRGEPSDTTLTLVRE